MTPEEKRYTLQYAKWHAKLEQKAAVIYYRALRDSVKPVIQTRNPAMLDHTVWQKAYQQVYRMCGGFIGRREYDWLRRNQKAVSFFDESFTAMMSSYGLTIGHKLENWLNQTTLEDIQRAFVDSSNQRLTDRQTAKLIYDYTLGVIGRQRALLIARTETTTATNYAKVEAGKDYLKEIGAPVGYKVWLTRADGKERHDHAEVNETGVLFDDKFIVGGFECVHPGDPNLPAKERVRCRCTFLTMSAGAYRRRYGKG